VIVPNSLLSRDTIVNYSEPTEDTCIEINVGVSYDALPNTVKATIREAIEDEPLLSNVTPTEILVLDFGASAVIYQIRAWTSSFANSERLVDRIRSAVYYALRRRGIEIPYPIQVEISREDAVPVADPAAVEAALQQVSIFASLGDMERIELARETRRRVFAAGERIVKQNDEGDSMFVLTSGSAVVTLDPGNREVATVRPGGFFGEMSLLTGAPRTATVRATADAEVLEITVESFRRFVLANPAVVDEIGKAVMTRQAELAQVATAGKADQAPEPPQRFLMRVRRFLRLSMT
jgi:CRP-like cAMP-binding protein